MTERHTFVQTVVEPNGPGGCNGPPIEVGVIGVTRTSPAAPTIAVSFPEPREDLLDTDFDEMSDDEIAALATNHV
jgi:hypothetical protein